MWFFVLEKGLAAAPACSMNAFCSESKLYRP